MPPLWTSRPSLGNILDPPLTLIQLKLIAPNLNVVFGITTSINLIINKIDAER